MPRTLRPLIIMGVIYDAMIIAGIFILLQSFKLGSAWPLAILFGLFIIPFASRDNKNRNLSFSIAYGLAAWIAWTGWITDLLTNWLDRKRIIPEHSLWDGFAFLLPFLFAIASGYWVYKKRSQPTAYRIGYLLALMLTAVWRY